MRDRKSEHLSEQMARSRSEEEAASLAAILRGFRPDRQGGRVAQRAGPLRGGNGESMSTMPQDASHGPIPTIVLDRAGVCETKRSLQTR